jgi:hypothetical protein
MDEKAVGGTSGLRIVRNGDEIHYGSGRGWSTGLP